MAALRAPYMARTDKERLVTGFWNRIESNQATDCNTPLDARNISLLALPSILDPKHLSASERSLIVPVLTDWSRISLGATDPGPYLQNRVGLEWSSQA